jgi:hypothetical protein
MAAWAAARCFADEFAIAVAASPAATNVAEPSRSVLLR